MRTIDKDCCLTVRPPRNAPSAKTPYEGLEYEIAQEKASALGRVGRRLEAALADLAAFDAGDLEDRPERRNRRSSLVGEAGMALWYLVVQREALGLRDTARVLRDYRVPPEVAARMGVVLPPPR